MGGKAKEHYWTISPPRSIVGGLPKPEYTACVSGTGSQRQKLKQEGDSVCVGMCVLHSHTQRLLFQNEAVHQVPSGVNMTISIIQS